MGEEREFSVCVVVSAISGYLLCDIGDLYEFLSFMVGRSVYTHELPMAGRQAAPAVLTQWPALGAATAILGEVTPANYRERVAALEDQLGTTITLRPIGWNTLADQSPLDSLREMVGDKPIVVVEVPPTEGAPSDA